MFLTRWFIATFVVAPITILVGVLIASQWFPVDGIHADDSILVHWLSALAFYGGYAMIGSAAFVALDTRIIRSRRRRPTLGSRAGIDAALGVLVLVPQALLFGRAYWLSHIAAGVGAGILYAVLVEVLAADT
jgi:hypothetical protein